MNVFLRRPVVYVAAGALVLLGLSQARTAKADPYQLPIASSGPVQSVAAPAPATVALQQLAQQVGYATFTSPNWHVGTVRHMVMFQYKKNSTGAQRAEVTARFLHLAQDSRRPDGKSVVTSIETGLQISGEGTDEGLQQAFFVTFRSEGDRNYYVGKPVITDPAFFDPAHEAFKEFAKPYLEKVVTFDYDVTVVSEPAGSAKKIAAKHSHH